MSPARWGPVVGHPANIIIAAFMFLLFIPVLILGFIRSNLLRRPNLPIRTQANDFTLLGPCLTNSAVPEYPRTILDVSDVYSGALATERQ
jgi:hypothetical protein